MNDRVATWLGGLSHCRQIRPVVVRIGREVFEGARYQQGHEYTRDMQECRSGIAKPGDVSWSDFFYLLGELPKCYQRRKSTCFTLGDETWYVATHAPKVIRPQFAEYHPFGQWFMLGLWTLDEAIDKYDRYKHERIPLVVEGL